MSQFKCNICFRSFFSENYLNRHLKSIHTVSILPTLSDLLEKKRKNDTVAETVPSKKPKVKIVDKERLVRCTICNIDVKKSLLHGHKRTNAHKSACTSVYKDNNIEIINSAFKSRIKSFKVNNINEDELSVERFLESIKLSVFMLINESLQTYDALKVNIELFGSYMLEKVDSFQYEIKSFNTTNKIITLSTNQHEIYDEWKNVIQTKSEEFNDRESGWTLLEILHLEVNINKYNPLRGSSYIDLPKTIKNKQACINVKNYDNECFGHAIMSALKPVYSNSDLIQSYPNFRDHLKFNGIDFPMKFSDISKFEKQNSISVNVFGLNEKKDKIMGPLHHTVERQKIHINLLYLEDKGKSHFCWIKNLSRLISRQLSLTSHRKYICDGCLQYFAKESLLLDHQVAACTKVKIILPYGDKTKMEFDSHQKKLIVPFAIYADFESIIKEVAKDKNPITTATTATENVQEHIPCSFAFRIVCRSNPAFNKTILYRGEDCVEVFVESLRAEVKNIYSLYRNIIPVIKPTKDEEINLRKNDCCHICEVNFNDKDIIVLDHDHLTGKVRGYAHNKCNLKFQTPKFIPIFFHNLCNYDSHLFIKELAKNGDGPISVLAQNKEKYITFSQPVKVHSDPDIKIKMRFVDSFKFMSYSLDTLSKNLKPEDFVEITKVFVDSEDIKYVTRKGIFPYEYVSSFQKFNETKLPPRDAFFSKVRNETVSKTEYKHAQEVWTHFDIQNLGEYSDLYLMTDVLLLSDVFEKFRNMCLDTYGLDCCWYFTAPSLSFDACKKITKIQFELLTDITMLDFVKSGIRGGISQCSGRFAKANNKYMKGFNPNAESTYLMYLDANNLYGWAMSKPLPYGGFQWVNVDEFNINQINLKPDVGYILEVDLDYPQNLHDLHNDLPFCVENRKPPNKKMSKLIPNLYNKTKYIIHSTNLLQALEHGLILKKIHRVLKFNQSTWLKQYIDLNTDMRSKATNKFEEDFFKLMNNCIYGKTMENIENRTTVKLVTMWESLNKKIKNTAEKLIAKPNFHSISIYSEDFVSIQMNKTFIYYNVPIYVGFVVLEMSKNLMYEFHYNYILKKYPNQQVTLLYMDTDSFTYLIRTLDVYEDMKMNLDKFDTSDYPPNNQFKIPLVNKKVIGLMKDENKGKIMKSFVGLRSKLYAHKLDDGKETKKAKGIKGNVVNSLRFFDYKTCFDNNNNLIKSMYIFKSIKHTIFTQRVTKIALSSDDDKRYIYGKDGKTLAWGHYRIPQ